MINNTKKIHTYILLVGMSILPSWSFYMLGSMSYGILLISILPFFFSISVRKNFVETFFFNILVKISIFAILFLLIHYCSTYIFFDNSNEIRFVNSFISFIILFLSAGLFGNHLLKLERHQALENIFKTFYFFLILLSILTFIRFSSLSPFYLRTNIYYTIFSEPSHFATSMLPFIAFYSVSIIDKFKKIVHIIFYIILALLIKNLSLLVGMVLIIFIAFKFKKIIKFLVFLFITLAILYLISFIVNPQNDLFNLNKLSYFTDRILLKTNLDTSSKVNMSVLVFMAGYHEILLNLIHSNFFGIGFQQFGITGEQSYIREIIYNNSGRFEYKHDKDASFLMGKIISEFGIFGLFFLMFYLKIFIKNLIHIKHAIFKRDEILYLFSSCCIVSFSIELFFRGSGYFTTGSYLFLVSLFIKIFYNLNDKKKN